MMGFRVYRGLEVWGFGGWGIWITAFQTWACRDEYDVAEASVGFYNVLQGFMCRVLNATDSHGYFGLNHLNPKPLTLNP